MNTQKTVTAANAAQSIDDVLWMLMYTATEGAGRVQGIRGHFGGPACFQAAYLPGADHDPASPTRTAPAGIRPSTAQHPTPCGTDRWFPFAGSLASTGFMYGMTGEATFNVARLGWGGGVGVLEMSVGKNGFSSRLGMGGMDISLGTLSSVGRGMQNWDTNNKINTVARNSNMDIGTALRTQWGFGDDMAKDQLAQLFSGSAVLRAGSGSGVARTDLINGQRVITLNGYREGMSREEQLAMGITLQHEAHRDGIVATDNHIETRTAVLAHTHMALRMANDNRYAASMNAVISGSTNLQNDLNVYFLSKKPENAGLWEAYVDGSYDSSADYWKLMKDGTLIDDNRSSLFIETNDGGEFKIWDMEGIGKDEALARILNGKDVTEQDIKNARSVLETMKQHGTDALIPQVVSEELQKRLGLYAIVKAETNLSEEAFSWVAQSSYKINDTLGYFVDFSIVEKDLLQNHYGSSKIGKPAKFMDPMDRYNFNGVDANTLVHGYGTIFSLGTTFEYQGSWGPGNNTPENHADNYRSSDELAYTQQKMANTHNSKLSAMGRPAITLDRKGNTKFIQTYSNEINYNKFAELGSFAGAVGMISQSIMGVQNAMENATNIQMPTWSVYGTNFFTVVGQSFRSLEWSSGSPKYITGPKFYSVTDMMFDRRVRNYANYLDNNKPRFTGFLGGLTGWNY